jgi:hypothetical protein
VQSAVDGESPSKKGLSPRISDMANKSCLANSQISYKKNPYTYIKMEGDKLVVYVK